MVGITNITNVTLENITNMANLTTGDPTEFIINVNNTVYAGWFFFIMLWVLAFILFRKAQEKQDQPLVNAMYVLAVCTIISFFIRAIYVIVGGVQYALITDFQMWIFPLLTTGLAAIVKYTSSN